MVRIAVLFMLLLAFLAPVKAKSFPFGSILPLQRINDDGNLANQCTTFSLNEAKGLWVTAAHCWDDDVPGWHPGFVELSAMACSPTNEADICVLYSDTHAPALKLAKHAPELGDEVTVAGYANGSIDPLVFFGRTSSIAARLTPDYTASVYNAVALPGDSGGPILNKHLEVVGVCQRSTQGGVVFGTPYEIVQEMLRKFQ